MVGLNIRLVVVVGLAASGLWAQERPKITGVAHIAIFSHDVAASRRYYHDFLGYDEVYSLKNPDGSFSMTFYKVNERQYIELFPEKAPDTDRLNHISIETDDAEALRKYLASRGVKVPEKVGKGRIGNSSFNIKDPDGHTVEITQYEPAGWTVRERGKALPETRISSHIMHVGILVGALEPAMKFYGDILGFKEIWRGSSTGTVLSWVNMRVPEGTDYIEFMLYNDLPAETKRGTAHHLALEVPSTAAAIKTLQSRNAYDKPMEERTGRNRKHQVNLFDPDGTRAELMEPNTVDGTPTPPSTAPPPHP